MKKRFIFYLAGIAIFAYFIYSQQINIDQLLDLKNPEFFLLAIVLFLSGFFLLALRMKILSKTLEEKSPGFSKFLQLEFFNRFISYAFPSRLNIPAKAIALNKAMGMGKGNALSLASFEYAMDTGTQILLAFSALYFFSRGLPYVSFERMLAFTVPVLVVLIAFFKIPVSFFEKTVQKSGKIKNAFIKSASLILFKSLKKIRETWMQILLSRKMFPVLVLVAAYWVVQTLVMESFFLSYGTYVPMGYILVIVAISIFVGGLSQIPGGLGVREFAMILMFEFLGVPSGIALVVVIARRLVILLPIALGFIVSLSWGYRFLGSPKKGKITSGRQK